MTSISQTIVEQVNRIALRLPAPPVACLHVPRDAGDTTAGRRDAEFCALELEDGSFGLSYLLLDDTLEQLLRRQSTAAPLAGSCPLELARQFGAADPMSRALALAAINALTQSAWRHIGYTPPPAGNSLGDVALTAGDHLGMIGFFPPLVHQVQAHKARLTVVELDAAMVARQRRRFPDVTVTLDRRALASCNLVVGTSTMLLNDTLDAMLSSAPAATRFAVIGPSAGLWPDALFARGVTLLGGTRVVDGELFRSAITRGAPWRAATHKYALARADWPGWEVLLAR